MTSMLSLGKRHQHAIFIPFPTQGHINPMMKLAKLLHTRGFHITFVNTEFNHKRLLKSRGPDSMNVLSSFRFETIPDGLPPSDPNATQDLLALMESTTKNCLDPFRDLLARLNNTTSSNVPPVSCIVSDALMCFTLEAAVELGIPEALFWTSSACSYLGYFQFSQLIDKGMIPLKDASYLTNGYLDTILNWIPGMEGIRLRDLPSFLRTTNPDEFMLKYIPDECERAQKASAIILNTYEELDHDFIQALSAYLPPIYSIGPLHFLENHVDDNSLKVLGSNLWKEDPEFIPWLDSKEPNSVIYVNFGSITVMAADQFVELAWGLANSKQNFFWIIRPDLVSGESAILPSDLVEETKERGLFASWCPQEQVLRHPSIGGFLTHSGWNSTLESISSGVPMICWPFFADQQTNCWSCCTKWGVGMEMNSDMKMNEVESLVKELMAGAKGKEMKKNALEWKRLAEEATKTSGSSYTDLEKLINQVLLSSSDRTESMKMN